LKVSVLPNFTGLIGFDSNGTDKGGNSTANKWQNHQNDNAAA